MRGKNGQKGKEMGRREKETGMNKEKGEKRRESSY